MNSEQVLKENLPTRLEAIADFLGRLVEKLRFLRITEDDLFKVKLVLEEALTNAMRHGNKLKTGLSVSVIVEVSRDIIIMEVKDEGSGFDHKNVKDPTLKENKDKPCGRGVFLMRSLMDKVEFSDSGRCVRLIKRIQRV